jgi:hypothetical protein
VKFGALSHSWAQGIVDSGGRDARDKNDRHMYQCQMQSLQDTFDDLLKVKSNENSLENFPLLMCYACLGSPPPIR